MKPAPFTYLSPRTVDEALAMLREHGETARVLAGGQTLLQSMSNRDIRPEFVIDINRVSGLGDVTEGESESVLGALVRQRAVEKRTRDLTGLPLLTQALPHVGHVSTRNRGTVVGSIVAAIPGAEIPVVFTAVAGYLTVRSMKGTRRVAAGDLYTGPLRTSLQPDELVVSASFPRPLPGERTAWLEFGRRPRDLPLVGVAVRLARNASSEVDSMVIACGGVADGPWTLTDADAGITGSTLDVSTTTDIADRVAGEVRPVTDARTSAAHRRILVRTLVQRALELVIREDHDVAA